MILGRVLGEVWASRRDAGLSGRKLLLIQPHHWYEPPLPVGHLVAVDRIGAGPGEDVLVCLGEPARQSLRDDVDPSAVAGLVPGYSQAAWLPVDAAVMAIVDRVDLQPTQARPLQSLVDSPSQPAESQPSQRGQR